MIASLLIANRGEIACRIIRTARAMGIRTVAVYSDADAKALHVRQADDAVHIGASPVRESYLCGDRIIAAALATGAEAIHPGYGFLSENAEFAQAVIDAGLIWVGPNPDSIRAMGPKDAAKARMIAAGVPVTPGYMGDDQSGSRLQAEADATGYPVLIKAVAGGGGKGMRRVDAAADFADALLSCRREAASSFGDDRVLIEKYILSPRHIEVQVFGDTHGNVVHLFERDCSLQRRHQKVIEEAPAPGMDEETREAICAAAVKAAKAVDYVGAGTIEFIADASEGLRADRIWFMEMNTRLQVEHPVTEEITGQDLVEWQLRVASGEVLPKRQDELAITGHAVEARLYAEDPARDFLPHIGRLERLLLGYPGTDPEDDVTFRLDTGVEQGDTISPFYDPMVAKLIVRAPDRHHALHWLAYTCADVQVWPVRTNANFLYQLAVDPDFAAGAVTTGFIATHLDRLLGEPGLPTGLLFNFELWLLDRQVSSGPAPSGFRLNADRARTQRVFVDGVGQEVEIDLDRHRSQDGYPEHDPAHYYRHEWIHNGDGAIFFDTGAAYQVMLAARGGAATGTAADGAILSPMPGRIIAVDVAVGDAVAKGQKLVTLEAMKMEHGLVAPFDGVVEALAAVVGGQVSEGVVLVTIGAGE